MKELIPLDMSSYVWQIPKISHVLPLLQLEVGSEGFEFVL